VLALVKQKYCPTCRGWLADNAAACPKCGHVFKAPGAFDFSDPVHILGIGVLAVFGFLVIVYIFWQVGLLN